MSGSEAIRPSPSVAATTRRRVAADLRERFEGPLRAVRLR